MEKPSILNLLAVRSLKAFDLQAVHAFRRFIKMNSAVDHWLLASNYNIGDKDRPHDVMAFTIYPISSNVGDLRDELASCFHADFKNVQRVSDRAKGFFWRRGASFNTFLTLTRPPITPHPVDGAIETWLGFDSEDEQRYGDPGHSDFWWISPEGLLYMKRGFQEDGLSKVVPGTLLDFSLPIWRTGEALLFARRLGAEMGNPTGLRFRFRWRGIQNRYLTSVDKRRMFKDDRYCRGTDVVDVKGAATIQQIDDNLAEVLFPVLRPLYEMFDFFPLAQQGVAEEIARLKERRY